MFSLRRRPIRILSLDGGGARGALSTLLLTALEQEIRHQSGNPDAHLAEYFDLIAGTSIGGIITALLTAPNWTEPDKPRYSAAETHELLLQYLPQAFSNVRNAGGKGLLSEKFDGRSLEMLMRAVFGHTRISELVCPTLITTYDLQAHRALFFCSHDYFTPKKLKQHSLLPLDAERKPDWFLRDICRATSAAPIVFKPAHIAPVDDKTKTRTLIDGGIFATNPTLCAYAEVRAKWKNNPRVTDMLIVSVGTGLSQTAVDTGGYLTGWGRGLQLIELLMNAGIDATHFQMDRIYGDQANPKNGGTGSYWRFNWPLEERISMDKTDPDTINALLRSIGDHSTDDTRDWVARGAKAASWINPEDKQRLSELTRVLLKH